MVKRKCEISQSSMRKITPNYEVINIFWLSVFISFVLLKKMRVGYADIGVILCFWPTVNSKVPHITSPPPTLPADKTIK